MNQRDLSTPPIGNNSVDVDVELVEAMGRFLQDEDVLFYSSLAQNASGIVVELGVGVGRVAQGTKAHVGVDISSSILKRCAELVSHQITLLHSPMQSYVLSEQASLTYAPCNAIMLLSEPTDLDVTMAQVFENTAPGGLFAFDLATPQVPKLQSRHGVTILKAKDPEVAIHSTIHNLDRAIQRVDIVTCLEKLHSSGAVLTRYYTTSQLRYYFPNEIEEAAGGAGWHVVARFGSFDGGSPAEEDRLQVWVLRKD